MRMRHFMAVCLASWAVSHGTAQSLSACEQCRGGHTCSSCQPSDDRGLLDRLDSLLVRRRPQLAPVTIPRFPLLDGSLCRAVTGRAACSCGAGPNCGCELKVPTCGCELNEPTCGCETQPAGRYNTHGHAASGARTSLQPAPPNEQLNQSYGAERYSESYISSPPTAAEQDSHRPDAPASLPVAPLPRHQPMETVPRPDSEVDPFRDESAGRVRRIPARAVQHTQSQRDYRQGYDAQARQEPVRMSLTDAAIGGQPQMAAGLNHTHRQQLDANGSSRHRTVEPIRTTTERLPEVVTAAGQRALGNGTSSSNADNGYYSSGHYSEGQAESQLVQRQAVGIPNPLRSSSR